MMNGGLCHKVELVIMNIFSVQCSMKSANKDLRTVSLIIIMWSNQLACDQVYHLLKNSV